MKGLTSNLLASFVAKGWSALLSLAFVPLYVRFLGVEAYGLIGAFLTLQAIISLLDLGMGAALTRELARSPSAESRAGDRDDLLRSLEIIYWGMAACIVGAVWLVAPIIAVKWLHANSLSSGQVILAIRLAGLSLAAQWPTNLYAGGLAGLQKQVLLASVTAGSATLRVAATVLALWLVSPTLETFFLVQAAANIFQTAVAAKATWQQIRKSHRGPASFRLPLVRSIFGFASGMTAIGITTVVLTQLDKAILTKTLPLESFGYYVVASTLASGLYIVVSPMFTVLFPRFAELTAKGEKAALIRLYRVSCQLMSVIIFPITAILAVFSSEILYLWTGNNQISVRGGAILSLLVIGNTFNGLMNMPYAIQLAHGWTSLTLYSNLIAICICGPMIYFLSLRLGALGAAIMWVVLMVGVTVTEMFLIHRRYGLGSVRRWYFVDVGKPALAAFCVVAIAKLLLPAMPRSVEQAAIFAVLTLIAGAAALLAAPLIRNGVLRNTRFGGPII